jgi:TolB-like protein
MYNDMHMIMRYFPILNLGLLLLSLFDVTHVYAEETASSVESGLKILAQEIVQKIKSSSHSTIAVLPFEQVDHSYNVFGTYLADELTQKLFDISKAPRIIERNRLETIIRENELRVITDPTTAQKLGNLSGVQALILGTITPIADSIRINARLVTTDTGETISTAAVTVPRTKTVDELIKQSLPSPLIGAGKTSTVTKTPDESSNLHASLTEDSRAIVKSLHDFAANIGKTATIGVVSSDSRAKALVEDYNNLIYQLQSMPVLASHKFIAALENFKSLYNANQTAAAVADLSKGIEKYLENFKANEAFHVSFAELVKNASKGVVSSDNRARVLRDEYNLLIRQIKKTFDKHSFIKSQKEIETMYNANDTATTIARSAKSIADILTGFQN